MENGKSITDHFWILDNLKETFKWTDEEFWVGWVMSAEKIIQQIKRHTSN